MVIHIDELEEEEVAEAEEGEATEEQAQDGSVQQIPPGGIEIDEEDALFIPMTIPKKMPREYYRGSDPEWQEFKKLSQDAKRLRDIQCRSICWLQ